MIAQALVRRFLARGLRRRLQTERYNAAVQIQKVWQGHRERLQFKLMLKTMAEKTNKPGLLFATKLKVNAMRLANHVRLLQLIKNNAAVRIQSLQRGRAARQALLLNTPVITQVNLTLAFVHNTDAVSIEPAVDKASPDESSADQSARRIQQVSGRTAVTLQLRLGLAMRKCLSSGHAVSCVRTIQFFLGNRRRRVFGRRAPDSVAVAAADEVVVPIVAAVQSHDTDLSSLPSHTSTSSVWLYPKQALKVLQPMRPSQYGATTLSRADLVRLLRADF